MKKNNDDKKSRKKKKGFLIAVIVALILFNYFYFHNKISANNELIIHYSVKDDPMEQYRDPAVAGFFYALDPQTLKSEIHSYLQTEWRPFRGLPKILIVPHAGYQYSGSAAAKAYRPLEDFAEKIETVILLGPSHQMAINEAALSSADYFNTPLGKIPLDKKKVEQLALKSGFSINNAAHKKEHSLEVQLPFLQTVIKNFKIVPIVYGVDTNPQEIAQALKPMLEDAQTILVVSADLSHYYSYETAQKIDKKTAQKIINGKANINHHESCGANGINTALILAQMMYLHPQTLSLINSGDTSGEKEKVVGYGAWAFEKTSNKLDEEQKSLADYVAAYKEKLLKIARLSIEKAVMQGQTYVPNRDDYDDALFDRGASFVTLEKNKNLRGCIGSVLPRRAIALDIAENAYAAALEDTRFQPVSENELKQIKITISLLTGLEEIKYQDEEDLLSQIKPYKDGLVILDGHRQGLFLPSVWEQLPDKKEFLNNLKLKVGMSPSYWSNAIKVYRFTTVEIKENEN